MFYLLDMLAISGDVDGHCSRIGWSLYGRKAQDQDIQNPLAESSNFSVIYLRYRERGVYIFTSPTSLQPRLSSLLFSRESHSSASALYRILEP